ncbi:Tetratricopeptide TPR2 [Penicillium expansum]|uniref:Tetratricopeptide TPR2 n=1 Tax=Penicillium expansum TaxID=27334 RepID=A0A0A2JS24_PENEN|nr:Tetratricopeptide TPR2 [Penicillium expansum]KGO43873.1 Tetratricopeptide TPR2 [Penicillium expansum]KGO57473.1 Tetratricopeptide TPR2 [Penicillium expansum]KGO73571.1 Tetratricopeptide TPR2 [Penicillium expansum]
MESRGYNVHGCVEAMGDMKVEDKIAGIQHSFSLLYADQGRLQEAEAMYERALEGKEKAWGRDPTSTLNTVNNLGNLYTNQGRLQEAEAMYERALEGKEKAWGRDHTSTLDTVNNLGLLYANQGRLQEAEAMYERALEGYEKALGATQMSTFIPALHTLENYGILWEEQGNVEKSLLYYQRALNGAEAVWGLNSESHTNIRNRISSLQRHPCEIPKGQDTITYRPTTLERKWRRVRAKFSVYVSKVTSSTLFFCTSHVTSVVPVNLRYEVLEVTSVDLRKTSEKTILS